MIANPKPWEARVLPNGERHVRPIDDLIDHALSKCCWCNPFDDDGVWVHNSIDRREMRERH